MVKRGGSVEHSPTQITPYKFSWTQVRSTCIGVRMFHWSLHRAGASELKCGFTIGESTQLIACDMRIVQRQSDITQNHASALHVCAATYRKRLELQILQMSFGSGNDNENENRTKRERLSRCFDSSEDEQARCGAELAKVSWCQCYQYLVRSLICC